MNTTKKARHRNDPAETVLDGDPFEGDLSARLADAPKHGRLPGPTVILVAGLLAVAGFISGVQAHKTWGGQESASAGAAFPGPDQNGRSQGGFPQRSGPGNGSFGGLTSGTVTEVSAGVVHLKTSDGRTVQVKTGGDTEITVSEKGSLKDLKPGTSVMVRGETAEDGTVTASSVTEGSDTGGFGGMRPRNGN
ncbi:DUF5666 domain-containing protein [Actinocorallia populi]|uniref:DUF5666 domain-containing protein n=1 Tax=Actinocorallia populi TaxID=2079200 RepID=UPI000D0937AE|nr:DUF5666 domain-containing protein [Actinocorallia populi]